MMYATGGRGTEKFIAEEIKLKFDMECNTYKNNEDLNEENSKDTNNTKQSLIDVRDGKVFFNISQDKIKDLLLLKSPERVFVTVKDYKNNNNIVNKRIFLNKLMPEMSNEENYQFVQTVLPQLFPHERGQSSSKGQRSSVCACTNENKLNYSAKGFKRKAIYAEETQNNGKTIKLSPSETEITSVDGAGHISQEQDSNHNLNSKASFSSYSGCDQKNYDKVELSCGECAKNNDFKENKKLTFRMSVKCSGKPRKMMNIERLSKDLAWRVSRATGWSCDLRNPLFEVCVHISDSHVTAGIPLTRFPLSKRSYISDSGLRSPVAWIMSNLAEIKPNETVLDPMCGKGTLLLEACSENKQAIFVGVDKSESQINTASSNIEMAGFHNNIHLHLGHCHNLPFHPGSVDKVICDAPFDQNHLIGGDPETFYFLLLSEMVRVLSRTGRIVLLTSGQLKKSVVSMATGDGEMSQTGSQSSQTLDTSPIPASPSRTSSTSKVSCNRLNLRLMSEHYVKLGDTDACILVLNKLSV